MPPKGLQWKPNAFRFAGPAEYPMLRQKLGVQPLGLYKTTAPMTIHCRGTTLPVRA